MDWKRNYRVAKRFYETFDGLKLESTNSTMDWKRNYRVAKQIYATVALQPIDF